MSKNLILILVLFFTSAMSLHAQDRVPLKHYTWSFVETGLIPIQSGGRVKPLDSLARETVLYMTGGTSFEGWNHVDLLLSWTVMPDLWKQIPFIKVTNKALKKQLLLKDERKYFSPYEIDMNPAFQGHIQSRSLDPEMKKLVEKLTVFQEIATGSLWRVVPKPYPQLWLSLAERDTAEGSSVRQMFYRMISSYDQADVAEFQKYSTLAKQAVQQAMPEWNKKIERKIFVESLFNRAQPFFWAWILYFIAAAIWYLPFAKKNLVASIVMSIGFAMHVFGIALRSYAAGRPPVTNMYESVIWVSLGVVIFAAMIFVIYKQRHALPIASVLAGLGLISAQSAPAVLDPSIHPLVPVLRDNFWLTTHVLSITLGYAAFALALGLGDFALYFHLKKNREKITLYNLVSYRAMQFGVIFLAAGTILGGVWADYSWGRFWGWDPKETWALIALLCYITVLHARFAGWMGPFGFSVFGVLSFLSVLMAWYGVNFVLGAGLHSYGFSAGGLESILVFIVLHIAYVLFVTWKCRWSKTKKRA